MMMVVYGRLWVSASMASPFVPCSLHCNFKPCRGDVKAAVYLALLADKSLLVAQKDMYIPNVSVTDFAASLALVKGI